MRSPLARVLIYDLLNGQAKSRSEANRLIAQGAVSIDGEKVTSNLAPVKSDLPSG